MFFFLFFLLSSSQITIESTSATSGPCPHQLDGEVLSQEVAILEEDHHIHLELHLEVLGRQRWAGKQTRKDHVDGDGEATAHIALGNLDILDFSC